MAENPELRRRIAEALLGCALDADFCAPCPGRDRHSGRHGVRDFIVRLDGAPTASCFHASCGGVVEEFNRELRRRINAAENGGSGTLDVSRSRLGNVPAAPQPRPIPRRAAFDAGKLAVFASRCRERITQEWMIERSPLAIPPTQGNEATAVFLNAIFAEGERVLVFTDHRSQGDFLHVSGDRSYRLGREPGAKAVPSALPEGGRAGVWHLSNPVKGTWEANEKKTRADGSQALGRRHGACITRWAHAVLESDEADESQWLAALVQFPLRIVAAYTSGGRSVHALIRFDASGKAEWDALRDMLLPVLTPLGADPGALTAVRLTRLPGCLRHGTFDKAGTFKPYATPRMQRLIWLNPQADHQPILETV